MSVANDVIALGVTVVVRDEKWLVGSVDETTRGSEPARLSRVSAHWCSHRQPCGRTQECLSARTTSV